MTDGDLAARLAGWAGAEPNVSVTSSGGEGTGLAIALDVEGSALTVRGTSNDAVSIEATVAIPPLLATPAAAEAMSVSEDVASVVRNRGGMLEGSVEGDGVHLSHAVYVEGLSRQLFVLAVREVSRAAAAIRTRLEGLARQRATLDALEGAPSAAALVSDAATPAPVPAPSPAVTAPVPVPAPSPAVTAPVPVPAPSPAVTAPVPAPTPVFPAPAPAPIPAAPPQPAAAGWTATHRVPATGVASYAAPDPASARGAVLQAGLPVRVEERRADWARVTASNGWSGWVDGRGLVAG